MSGRAGSFRSKDGKHDMSAQQREEIGTPINLEWFCPAKGS